MNIQIQVVFSWLYFASSILLWQKSFSLDPNYEACVPKDCGNGINISFPFYIPDHQPSFCGYPGYEVNCSKQGDAMVLLPHNDYYIIEQISYENRSVRIYNSALLSSRNRNSCLPEIRNLTLLNELNKFLLNPTSVLYLFSSCNKVLPEELSRYKVGCDGLVILAKDRYSDYAKKECKSVVVAPVELQVTEGSTVGADNYEELLRKGFLVGWQSSPDCRECSRSGGRCGFDSSVYRFKCFCPDGPHAWNCDSTRERKWVVKFVSGISASGIAVILFLYLTRKYFPGEFRILGKKSEDHENIEAFLKNYGSFAPKRYSYSDIKKITNSFKEKLGQGGYGSVYKGTLLCDRILVAVKVLHEAKGNGEQFVNEVASISKTSHVNIVSLLGFCFEGSKRALIYEFVPNGSLEKFIYNENSLSKGAGRLNWENLLEIAVGIARGLEYLHRGCSTRILHLDIKPHNILLDKDFRPKICDFGLAKLCPDTVSSMISSLGARGTVGYIAPEVFFRNFGDVSHKSDVYSYGMMIMEMVRGRKACDTVVDISSDFYFPNWIYDRLDLEDIGLRGLTNEMEYQRARKMVIVGLWCIQAYPITRPSMGRVVEMLEGSIENLQTPPKPFLSSPPRLEPNSIDTS